MAAGQFFIKTLYDELEDPSNELVIGWANSGTTVVIHDLEQFQKKIMEPKFLLTKLLYFKRQLTVFGFTILNDYRFALKLDKFKVGKDKHSLALLNKEPHIGKSSENEEEIGSEDGPIKFIAAGDTRFRFKHPDFLRGRPRLLSKITKIKKTLEPSDNSKGTQEQDRYEYLSKREPYQSSHNSEDNFTQKARPNQQNINISKSRPICYQFRPWDNNQITFPVDPNYKQIKKETQPQQHFQASSYHQSQSSNPIEIPHQKIPLTSTFHSHSANEPRFINRSYPSLSAFGPVISENHSLENYPSHRTYQTQQYNQPSPLKTESRINLFTNTSYYSNPNRPIQAPYNTRPYTASHSKSASLDAKPNYKSNFNPYSNQRHNYIFQNYQTPSHGMASSSASLPSITRFSHGFDDKPNPAVNDRCNYQSHQVHPALFSSQPLSTHFNSRSKVNPNIVSNSGFPRIIQFNPEIKTEQKPKSNSASSEDPNLAQFSVEYLANL